MATRAELEKKVSTSDVDVLKNFVDNNQMNRHVAVKAMCRMLKLSPYLWVDLVSLHKDPGDDILEKEASKREELKEGFPFRNLLEEIERWHSRLEQHRSYETRLKEAISELPKLKEELVASEALQEESLGQDAKVIAKVKAAQEKLDNLLKTIEKFQEALKTPVQPLPPWAMRVVRYAKGIESDLG